MATQPAPTYEQFKSLATPALHPPLTPRRVGTPSRLRAPVHKTSSQESEKQRLLVRVELDDMISDGVLGLVDALGKFDTAKRVKLESYARHRIRGGILDGLRSADPASRDLRRKN